MSKTGKDGRGAYDKSRYQPGLSSVGQYQVGAIPWISSSCLVRPSGESPVQFEFPYVSKFVTVINEHSGSNAALRVGFSNNGCVGGDNVDHYFLLNNGESYTGEWRVTSVYLMGDTNPTTASIVAGLTGIPSNSLRSNWSGSSDDNHKLLGNKQAI